MADCTMGSSLPVMLGLVSLTNQGSGYGVQLTSNRVANHFISSPVLHGAKREGGNTIDCTADRGT
jgi:hypothetical protein